MIRNKMPTNPGENRILFNSTELGEFFTISCFKLDLKNRSSTHIFNPPQEDIGVACQQEEFDLDALLEHFQGKSDQPELDTDELKRVPLVTKRAPTADIMDLEETEEKLQRYCQLWELYAKASCEMTKISKISQEEAANACKVLDPYIMDIIQQFEMVNTIFRMEKELRALKNRGESPVPRITPQGTQMGNPKQEKRILEAVDEEVSEIIIRIR